MIKPGKIRSIALLLLTIISQSALAQDRVQVSAYDRAHPNGLVVVTSNQNFFGLRFLIYRQGTGVESSPQQVEFGSHATNGDFSEIHWRSQFDDKTPITLRWSRFGKRFIIGRLTAPPTVRVAIEAYRPWELTESWGTFSVQVDRRTIFGEQVQSTTPGLRRMLFRTDRTGIGAANCNSASVIRDMLIKEGHVQNLDQSEENVVGRLAALSFDLTQNQSIGFVLGVGDDFDVLDREATKLLQKPIVDLLNLAEKSYENTRPFSNGALGDSLETVTRALNWNRYYWPDKGLEFIAVQRQSGNLQPEQTRGIALSWNSFFTGAMATMIDGAAASATMHALLEGQLSDGRVPLRRYPLSQLQGDTSITSGRSMLPIGSLSVWRVYLATRNLELLAWAYPRLKQWNEWWFADRGDGQSWRDGNGDGLLEYGYDAEAEQGGLGARMLSNDTKRRFAFSESGLEERPQWNGAEAQPAADANGAGKEPLPDSAKSEAVKFNDRSHTLEFSSVGLNSLYALDTETLAMIARELGLAAEAMQLQGRYEKIKTVINSKLWSEEDKLYLNRHWDGRFSRRLSLENFYPLIAGLAEEERAKQLLEALRDPKRFGFQHLLPTIARDDSSFDGKSAGRGAAWAPMNYLVYLGLKRHGFHDEAAELARRGIAVTRTALEKTGRLYDLFSSDDLRAIEDENALQRISFGGLMLWPAIEELITTDPWAGLTFGSPATSEEARVERVNFSGAVFDVIAGPKRTVIRRNEKIELECEGAARLRAYRVTDHAIGFSIETKEQIRILVPAAEGKKITVSVDDKVLGSTSVGAAASFKVPSGTHKVLIVK